MYEHTFKVVNRQGHSLLHHYQGNLNSEEQWIVILSLRSLLIVYNWTWGCGWGRICNWAG